jgi:UDP-N-acetylmuramoylalanine--D-glutamate ligase
MKIAILGAGESGVGAAILAKKLGYQIWVSDKGTIKENFKKELEKLEIPYEENKHTIQKIFETSEVIKSPGIPDDIDLIKELNQKGIPVISEIEFAARHTKAKIVAITGSNGKTTTTNLTYHLLKNGGLNVGIAGNVGFSFARLVALENYDYFVLELSSFQLDGILEFGPDVAILLNITPDHLDRYDYKMENYVASKFRIIKNQTENDFFIFNGKDENMNAFLEKHPLKMKTSKVEDNFYKNEKLLADEKHSFDMSQSSLKGRHNMFNAVCSIRSALHLGVTEEKIQEGLNTFVNDPHRLESVATISGVEFINDSKATNVEAVYYALETMEKGIIWIVGGIDKGNDYSILMPLVEEKVNAIICLGLDNTKILEAFSPVIKIIEEAKSAKEAVEVAESYAEEGEVVLLSPACSSFDLFENYKDRGDQFKKAVFDLRI